MQRILIVLLSVSTAVAGWFAFDYSKQLRQRDTQIATLTAERDTARAAERAAIADADPLKENIERLKRERDRLLALSKSSGLQPPPPQPPPGFGGPNPGGMMQSPMAAMLKSPEGRQMISNRTAARVKSQYTELARRLKLPPQDTDVLLSLLADRQTAILNARVNSGGNAADLASQTASIQSEFDEKLKATLGEEGFDQYNQYEQTVEARTAVNQLEGQFSSAGLPLEATQKENLIQLLSEETKKSPANPFDPTKNDPTSVLNALKDDAAIENWVQQQQDFQNRVIQSASKTLTPDQVTTLQQSLQQKAERDKMGLQMFKTTGTPPPPPQAQ
jgi:hypothetical protein